jgi:CheY-like chemotaxis protein
VQLPSHHDNTFKYVPFKKSKGMDTAQERSISITLKQDNIDIRKILLVDDSVPNVKVCKRLLTNAGYEVEVAYNGEECIRKLETIEDFNLIIIDNHMPVMDGPTAVKILRSRDFHLPIVGLTGSITPEELRDFKTAGCDEVLCKPLNIQKLNEVLRSVHRRTRGAESPKESARESFRIPSAVIEEDGETCV